MTQKSTNSKQKTFPRKRNRAHSFAEILRFKDKFSRDRKYPLNKFKNRSRVEITQWIVFKPQKIFYDVFWGDMENKIHNHIILALNHVDNNKVYIFIDNLSTFITANCCHSTHRILIIIINFYDSLNSLTTHVLYL